MIKKEFRKAVMAVIVNNYNRVLIGSSPRDGGFKFPQGGLDPGEDVISGIKRELNEELGISVRDSDITYVSQEKVIYFYPPGDPYYIYKGQELAVVKIKYHRDMVLIPQDDEFDELHWIAPSHLHNFNTNFRAEAYLKALRICGLL